MQYRVLRKAHTEIAVHRCVRPQPPGRLLRCVGCGARLFSSDAKFNSDRLAELRPARGSPRRSRCGRTTACFMRRTESCAAAGGGHLGHVFNDRPQADR